MFGNLKELILCGSADFDSDESVVLLALTLGRAYRLKKVNIAGQQGNRKIDVEVSEEKVCEFKPIEFGRTFKF